VSEAAPSPGSARRSFVLAADGPLFAARALQAAAALVAVSLLVGARPVRAEDEAGALREAVARGAAGEVARLLSAGADPDAGDSGGWTALHEAAARGDLAVSRALLGGGARPDPRSRARGTPLDVAESSGRLELARLLRAAGARGSGKSIGDTVCVRPWSGDGYCAVVTGRDKTRFELRLTELVGCARGCPADAACSASRAVGADGLAPGDTLTVPASCLTHTGVR
jgi:ankyrin repeat protein